MSNEQIKEVARIRADYEEKKTNPIDELKALDKRVKAPASIFAYTFGIIGSLILGTGMCLAMPSVIEGFMPLGIAIGVVGIAAVSANYFIYKRILEHNKRKHASEIFRLSGEILGEDSAK